MNIGAAALIKSWGRDFTLSRDGFVLIPSFKCRRYNNRPETAELDYSVDQELYRFITLWDYFAGSPQLFPQKFDKLYDQLFGKTYTIQSAFEAGTAIPEVVRIVAIGGQT